MLTIDLEAPLPRVTIKMDIAGREEELREYLCDWPDCSNIATQVLGRVKELGICSAVCEEHATTNSSLSQRVPPE
jgi:hypothetical protein